ncbi:ABC transporter [Thecamonas trahens ATCC 50062]|uniref:ABC transporter n=1 Tax=Thecamonas trahens ATCC 50062 TaxID=461836 RepID=A0A0L0DIC8_THETB|nr:ABC transporter [Thecamonas trahens ATCC 50062]KNC51861.1 ABC transporter [Thecamonas trahens ATCC 50062]|eukprot:XP_013755722.1 ABC transporter [Thecamonas trahens ATCC 50062]
MSCFRKSSSSHARLAEGDPEAQENGGRRTTLQRLAADFQTTKRVVPYLWPAGETGLKVRVVAALVFMAFSKILTVMLPLFYKAAIDALTTSPPTMPTGIIIGYGLVRLGSQAFSDGRDATFIKVTQNALRSVALRTFTHLHSLSLDFHLKRKTGGVLRAISRGTRGISTILSFFLFNIGPIILEVLFTCGILLVQYEGWFALITFVTIVTYIVWTLVITEWRNKFRREMNAKDNDANDKAVDSLLNYETVKYFSNEGHEQNRYDFALRGYMKAAIASQSSLMVLNVGQAGLIAVGVTSVMLLAARRVVSGHMTAGDFVLVNTYLLQLYLPLNFLGSSYRMIKQGLVDVDSMMQLLDVPRDVVDVPVPEALPTPLTGAVEFNDVYFRYRDDVAVLNGVSFEVPAGGSLALVGASGAGKSTIARLLYRFYDVNSGAILLDGVRIDEVDQAALRRQIGIVPQDTVLFNDTLGYNIRYGNPRASHEQVVAAARAAQIHEFVESLPEGYETKVGERGLRLSGGEKQRVAIARALLKDPPVMIFDEATSALDTRTEREIQDALASAAVGRTTITIAHRLSTIVDVDQIVVLGDGCVLERGTHDELVARDDGAYAALWEEQQREQF